IPVDDTHLMSLTYESQAARTASPIDKEPIATVHDVKCCWDGCGIPLPSISMRSIHVHLGRHHSTAFERPCSGKDRRRRGRCLWVGCKHRSDMLFSSVAKHICTRHLKVLTVQCRECGEEFSRGDSLDRH
ncbi:hypothetical protein B0H21DRAFT_673408, partial [Amylocystis lapponica]